MPADAEDSRQLLSDIIADRSRHLCVVAYGADVVGAAELVVVPNLTHHARPWAVVENVIVTKSARGNWAGTALIEHLVNVACARGCYKVQLHSGKQRADAHRLYRRLGFVPVAEGFKLYFDNTAPPNVSTGY
jgi:GNAT superfamily N-acetyltransferase